MLAQSHGQPAEGNEQFRNEQHSLRVCRTGLHSPAKHQQPARGNGGTARCPEQTERTKQAGTCSQSPRQLWGKQRDWKRSWRCPSRGSNAPFSSWPETAAWSAGAGNSAASRRRPPPRCCPWTAPRAALALLPPPHSPQSAGICFETVLSQVTACCSSSWRAFLAPLFPSS